MITLVVHVWQKVRFSRGGEAEIQEFIKAVLLHYHESWIEADSPTHAWQ